jgi:hypothetical protein
MSNWKLSPLWKKNAVERQFWYKDGKLIIREEGYRWGTFYVSSVERPLTNSELRNDHGYELCCIDNDECWEMDSMEDGCWSDLTAGNDKTTDEDIEEFEAAWEEDYFEGAEELGWTCDDTEYWYYGPLELTNEDTGETFTGEDTDTAADEESEVVKEDPEEKPKEDPSVGAKWPF